MTLRVDRNQLPEWKRRHRPYRERGFFFFFFVGEGRASQNEIKATKGAEINTDNKSNETGVLVATECDLVGGMIDRH